jgi:DNA-binding CsgD family transcriptional regulator
MSYGLETIKLTGRATKVVEADFVRPLEPADMELLTEDRQVQKPRQLSSLSMLSERHRNLARLLAMGKPDWECAVITGYTQSRISILKSDPAMQNLIKHYSEEKDIVFVQAHEKMAQVASTALDVLQDRLEDAEHVAKMSDGQLLEIVKTAADRSGLGPASKSEVNVNVNIADRLEAARKRAHESRMIEAKAVEVK